MYTLQGARTQQEDCGFALEVGGAVYLGVADGFRKEGYSGREVSDRVISEALVYIALHRDEIERDPRLNITRMFGLIDKSCEDYVAGSTFAFAFINQINLEVTVAVVGDSVVVVEDALGMMHIHPEEDLKVRRLGLRRSFGDRENRKYRLESPVIDFHKLGKNSVVLVGTDGLYPIDWGDDFEKFKKHTHEYIEQIRSGKSSRDLAEYALDELKSPDNITVAIYAPR